MEIYRNFLLTYFPYTNPIWIGADQKDQLRIDVFLIEEDSYFDPYYVVSTKNESLFIPEAFSNYPHIPYDKSLINKKPPSEKSIGVFVNVEQVYDGTATKIIFRQSTVKKETDIIAHHATIFTWDTTWLSLKNQPKPESILLDNLWIPSVASSIAVTPDEFFRSYRLYYDSKRDDCEWAPMSFFDTESWEEKLCMIQCIVDRADEHAYYLGHLAAGPVEDLLSHRLLDYIINDNIKNKQKWCTILKGVYTHNEQFGIKIRVKEMIENLW